MGHQTFFRKYSNNQILKNIVIRMIKKRKFPLPLRWSPV